MEQEKGASDLLTADEVARILRLRPATIYEAAADGRIPHVRLWSGTRRALVRFRRADIEAFLRDRTFDPTKRS